MLLRLTDRSSLNTREHYIGTITHIIDTGNEYKTLHSLHFLVKYNGINIAEATERVAALIEYNTDSSEALEVGE